MKNTLFILCLISSFSLFAKDMSRTENRDHAFKANADGEEIYIGGCSVHQDYENKMFVVTETIVPYFEPSHKGTQAQFDAKVAGVEKELLAAVKAASNIDELKDVDDLTVEKIKSLKFKDLDLYRLNIGVGGGNGYYEVYNRVMTEYGPVYTRLSNVFDGDIEFCDSKVWLKK